MNMEIRGALELPARREEIELHTLDGLTLVGELALPAHADPVATLVTLHPLPTAGGFMDSHILRKAAARLPALADLAVLRFNTRGTSSPRGTSEGTFDGGHAERFDVAAAMQFVHEAGLPHPWLVGWSFGTELALKYGLDHEIDGAILLSPPLHRATASEVAAWAGDPRQLIALIDDRAAITQADARDVVSHDTLWLVVEAYVTTLGYDQPRAAKVVDDLLATGMYLPIDSGESLFAWAYQEGLLPRP